MARRTRTCYNKSEFRSAIADFERMGYELKSRSKRSATLVKKREKKYHGLIALLTIWWSFGLVNLIYALLPPKKDDEVILNLKK